MPKTSDTPKDPATGVIFIPEGASSRREEEIVAACLAPRTREKQTDDAETPAIHRTIPPDDRPTDRSWTSPCSWPGH